MNTSSHEKKILIENQARSIIKRREMKQEKPLQKGTLPGR